MGRTARRVNEAFGGPGEAAASTAVGRGERGLREVGMNRLAVLIVCGVGSSGCSAVPRDMVLVRGGSFQMGNTFDGGDADEKPVHQVELDSFLIGKHEVTVGEFNEFVVATGYDFFDPTCLGQYHYGSCANVITALEYERLISASGPTGGHLRRPSDGSLAKTIGFVQCTGSRHVRHNRYCSTVCCVHSAKEAVLAWEHDHDVRSYVFYTDLRGSGKGFREYMQRAEQDYQVTYVHGRVAQILEDADENPIIWFEEASTSRPQRMTVDLAVLATSLVPRHDARQLAEVLEIELDDFGFAKTEPFAPVDTSRPGIVACGCCVGPSDIPQSVTQASAAAARAAEMAMG